MLKINNNNKILILNLINNKSNLKIFFIVFLCYFCCCKTIFLAKWRSKDLKEKQKIIQNKSNKSRKLQYTKKSFLRKKNQIQKNTE